MGERLDKALYEWYHLRKAAGGLDAPPANETAAQYVARWKNNGVAYTDVVRSIEYWREILDLNHNRNKPGPHDHPSS